MNRSRRRRIDDVLLGAAVVAIAWGALAFGAVYPWGYTPLAIACAIIGATAVVVDRGTGPAIGSLAAALSAVAVAAALQLVPLPPATFARISPAGDAFLRNYDLSYQLERARPDETDALSPDQRPHPISIDPTRTVRGLALFAAFAVLLVGMNRLLSAQGAMAITRPLIVLGVGLALFAIAQAGLLSDREGIVRKIYGFWQPRFGGSPFGPFVNRNHFAGWTIMVLPLAMAAGCAAWERARTRSGRDFRDRMSWLSTRQAAGALLMTFAAGVMSLALLMSQSRSGLAGCATSVLIFAWVLVPRQATARGRFAAAALVGGLFIGAMAWAGIDMIAGRLSSAMQDVSSPMGRLQAWSDTSRIIADFPLTGTGLNTYGTAMLQYQTGDRRLQFQEAHNDYLQLMAEGGLLVAIPAAIALGVVVRDMRRRFREAPRNGTTYWLRVGAVAALVSIAVQSLFEFSLQMPGNAALFAVIAAIALHRSPNLRRVSSDREPPNPLSPAGCL